MVREIKHEYTPGEVHNHGHTHFTEEGHHPAWGQHIVNGRFGNIPLYGFEHTHAHTHPVPEKEDVPESEVPSVPSEDATDLEASNAEVAAVGGWDPPDCEPIETPSPDVPPPLDVPDTGWMV